MATILLVDDDESVGTVLGGLLSEGGHTVLATKTGRDGIQLAQQESPDLVILDLTLQDMSGTEVCRALKRRQQTRSAAIVILSALSSEVDRIVAFELGVDDYVTKPFSAREMALRVRAVLRRRKGHEGETETPRVAGLKLDSVGRAVWLREERLQLTRYEYGLLVALARDRNRVQTRAELFDRVWGGDTCVSLRTVDAHIQKLRDKLRNAPIRIETVRGVGYLFSEDATSGESDSEAAQPERHRLQA